MDPQTALAGVRPGTFALCFMDEEGSPRTPTGTKVFFQVSQHQQRFVKVVALGTRELPTRFVKSPSIHRVLTEEFLVNAKTQAASPKAATTKKSSTTTKAKKGKTGKKGGEKKRTGKQATKKKKTDPNRPKNALSAFTFFCKEERSAIKEAMERDCPGSGTFAEVAKAVGVAWKEMDDDDKAPFDKLNAKDKKRREAEMENYTPRAMESDSETKTEDEARPSSDSDDLSSDE